MTIHLLRVRVSDAHIVNPSKYSDNYRQETRVQSPAINRAMLIQLEQAINRKQLIFYLAAV